jgi:hypothetical protein
MQISNEQAESTHLLDSEGFINRLCEEVAQPDSWVVQAWPPQFIRERVRYAYNRATIANGLERDVDIRIYVGLFFEISAEFDQHPAIAKVLHDSSLMPDEKWDLLMEDEQFVAAWDDVEKREPQIPLFPEGKGKIEDAYPTTYHLSGFQKLYDKVRNEDFPYLEEGEYLSD